MRKIIDFHTHIYPEKIVSKATKSVGDFYDREMYDLGSVAKLFEHKRDNGISHFVVHPVATVAAQVISANDFVAKVSKEHPETVTAFGTLHPDFEDIPGEVERIIGMGLKGIKLHPDFQRFNIDDKDAMKIYEAIEGRLPLLVHTGDYRSDFSHPRRMANVIKKFPKLTVVGAHFGGWSVQDEAIKYLLDLDCYVDCSSTFQFIMDNKRSRELIDIWGPDRILFGTDFPMHNYNKELEMFFDICSHLSDEEIDKILYKNAEKLIGGV